MKKQFISKGLVVGYVQSGKTANFTALISKAADAGFRLIIVLAGIHDILRLQTQLRLDKELTGIDDRNLEPLDFISLPAASYMWQRLTTAQGSLRGVNLPLLARIHLVFIVIKQVLCWR